MLHGRGGNSFWAYRMRDSGRRHLLVCSMIALMPRDMRRTAPTYSSTGHLVVGDGTTSIVHRISPRRTARGLLALLVGRRAVLRLQHKRR